MDKHEHPDTRPELPQVPTAPARSVTRREFLASGVALAAGAVAAPDFGVLADRHAASRPHPSRDSKMSIVCIIRYEIDPFQRDAFREYAENWGRIIPRCGGHLVGYFMPWQGTNYVGWGLIAFDSLASYETYQKRLRQDPDGRKNFAFAQNRRFILKEERNFIEVVGGTFDIPAAA